MLNISAMKNYELATMRLGYSQCRWVICSYYRRDSSELV
jgi:hypothetical protein